LVKFIDWLTTLRVQESYMPVPPWTLRLLLADTRNLRVHATVERYLGLACGVALSVVTSHVWFALHRMHEAIESLPGRGPVAGNYIPGPDWLWLVDAYGVGPLVWGGAGLVILGPWNRAPWNQKTWPLLAWLLSSLALCGYYGGIGLLIMVTPRGLHV
jgi:hypothetical protein